MKLLRLLPPVFLLCFAASVVTATGIPSAWDQGKAYSKDDLVIYGGTTYQATSAVPAGTPTLPNATSSLWKSLDALAGDKSTPAGKPDTTPSTSGLTGLQAPTDSNGTLTGGRLMNLSTRGYVGSGAQRMVGGFRVYGGSLQVLIRGFGPSRPNDDNLDDPYLTWKVNPPSMLPDTAGIVNETDDSTGNANLNGADANTTELLSVLVAKETADIQTCSNFENNNSKGYTAMLTPKDGTAEGIGRFGLNDISGGTGDAQLVNIATRAYVGSTNAEYLIAGFQIRGGSVKVCIRAFGPSRSNSDALSDPQIELIQQVSDYHTEKKTLGKNDDWKVDYDDGTTVTANTSASVPSYLNALLDKESAIVITLPAGDYSAKVSGVNGATGIGRVGIDKVIE